MYIVHAGLGRKDLPPIRECPYSEGGILTSHENTLATTPMAYLSMPTGVAGYYIIMQLNLSSPYMFPQYCRPSVRPCLHNTTYASRALHDSSTTA